MLARRIIPCLDVKDGRVVKGVHFVDLGDAGDPVEVAARYDAAGADELCFLDITASHEERPIMLDVVARTAERCFMPLTVGGGVRTVDDMPRAAQRRRRQGVDQHGGGRATRVRARARPSASARSASSSRSTRAGARRTTRRGAGRCTRTAAARRPASTRSSGRRAWRPHGAGEILLTSMDRDGTKDGYDLELTRAVADRVDIPVIASGGVGNARAHATTASTTGGASAALAASIFHYGTHTIGEAKEYLAARGVCVRQDGGAA